MVRTRQAAGGRESDVGAGVSRPLVITPGDPLGVGPELVARCLSSRAQRGKLPPVTVVGHRDAFVRYAVQEGLPYQEVREVTALSGCVALYGPHPNKRRLRSRRSAPERTCLRAMPQRW